MKIIYIMGKSASGKDTIYHKLKEKLNIASYVMYTTRPMREGEKEGLSYYFISYDDMQKYIENKMPNPLIEERTYQTVYGPWIYATILDEQFKGNSALLMTGTLESYKKVKEYFQNKKDVDVKPIYIEVPDRIRLERAILREDKEKEPKYVEMCRRFVADSQDFSEEKLQKCEITNKYMNIDLEECLQKIIDDLK